VCGSDLGEVGGAAADEFRSTERQEDMNFRTELALIVLAMLILVCTSPSLAQKKGEWVPGQFGLNAGVIPDPASPMPTWL
jgi:hypothetical protein